MTPSFRRTTPLLAALGLLSLTAPAAAQDVAAAEALFERGLADMQAGRYETGCKALAESERLDPQPGTLFTLAYCEARWGRIASAVARFNDYLALFERMSPVEKARQGERAKVARQERDSLSPRVPKLALSLPPDAPDRTVVKRNGHALGSAALGVPLRVDPGEHLITIETPGGAVWEQRITIAEGETRNVVLEMKASPPTEPSQAPAPPAPAAPPSSTPPQASATEVPPAPPASPTSSARRTAAYVTGGVGTAGVVLGGILGALVIGKKGVVDQHCGSGIQASDKKACDATGLDAANSALTMARVSTIAFGAGLTALGAAAVLLWTEPHPTGAATGARPRWLSAGVLEAGPTGAILGAQGSF